MTTIAEDICELGTEFVKAVDDNSKTDPTTSSSWAAPRATRSAPTWQDCAEKEIAKHQNLKLLGKADTNWTQEGTFEAMSGLLAQHDSVDALHVSNMPTASAAALRAYEAAGKKPD